MCFILRRVFALVSCSVFLYVSTGVQVVSAAPISTAEYLRTESSREFRAELAGFFARQDVADELVRFGVDPEEAQLRIATLSDDEIKKIHGALGETPAGADGLGTVVGAILIVFFVLLLTDILGLTKVYPFTRSINR